MIKVNLLWWPKPQQPTARQLELLQLSSYGLIKKEVASHMGITEKMVNVYASRIFDRFDLPNRNMAAAVALAFRYGWLK